MFCLLDEDYYNRNGIIDGIIKYFNCKDNDHCNYESDNESVICGSVYGENDSNNNNNLNENINYNSNYSSFNEFINQLNLFIEQYKGNEKIKDLINLLMNFIDYFISLYNGNTLL